MVGNNGAIWNGLTAAKWANINRFDVEYCSISNATIGIDVSDNTYGNVSFTSLYVYAGQSEGIKIGKSTVGYLSGNVTIRDCQINQRGSHGIFVKAINGTVTIEHNSVYYCTGANKYGIFTESCPNATVYNNLVQGCYEGIHAWDVDGGSTYVGYNDVYDCTSSLSNGIWRGRGSTDTVGNEIHNCSNGIKTDDYGGTVENNYIYVPSGGKGIYLYTGSTPYLTFNTISWQQSGTNGGYGIYGGAASEGTCNPTLWGNSIQHVNTGIYLGPGCNSQSKTRWSVIAYCGTAFYIDGCSPDLGTQSDYGNNNVHDITNWFIVSTSQQTLRAAENWWGANRDPVSKMSGNIDYTPWLPSAP